MRACAVLLGCVGACLPALAGVYIPVEGQPADRVVHPAGYQGQGGQRLVRVCLDPATRPTGADPTQSIRNAVAAFNELLPVGGNVTPHDSARPDFESMLLHELGHCLGMGHNVHGPIEVDAAGAGNESLFHTNALVGPNRLMETIDGGDGVRGSHDDWRGDDVNLHWFRRGVNDPFELPGPVVDRQSHTVDLAALPEGHRFAEAATHFMPCLAPGGESSESSTSRLRQQLPTQSVVFPVLCLGNRVRALSPDDVTLLRIARAGLDGVQGTADDYTTRLVYSGEQDDCDIPIRFVAGTGFAECRVSLAPVAGSSDVTLTAAEARFEPAVNWSYNTLASQPADAQADLALAISAAPADASPGQVITVVLRLDNLSETAADAVIVDTDAPPGLVFLGNRGDCATAFPCALGLLNGRAKRHIESDWQVAADTAAGSQAGYRFTVSADTPDPLTGNNAADGVLTVFDPALRILRSGFEAAEGQP